MSSGPVTQAATADVVASLTEAIALILEDRRAAVGRPLLEHRSIIDAGYQIRSTTL